VVIQSREVERDKVFVDGCVSCQAAPRADLDIDKKIDHVVEEVMVTPPIRIVQHQSADDSDDPC
jgi:hypothetical protein